MPSTLGIVASHATPIVTSGLILHLDASDTSSYPGTGTTWFDLSGQDADATAGDMPTFVADGQASYFDFDGTSDKLNSVNVTQDYKDLFIVQRLSQSARSISTVFAVYPDQDKSLRYLNYVVRTSPDFNDWNKNQNARVFVNGSFNAAGVNLAGVDTVVRSYRSNTSSLFGSPFRYQLSSDRLNRRFKGRLYMVLCYDRLLSDDEVRQNFAAVRTRFGI